ncbi:MAG: Gfo/Idh/MocA family oxidoreductase [Streptosporangiaceae bacterium]|jgi:myo-inositol 2-dehydrogenase/D-chiro-inositol 1-dehydrogenase
MTPTIRIGLAGLGRMGRIHAASLSGRCPSARLACVFDASEGAAAQVGEQFGVPVAPSYEDMLAGEAIDAVAIATPTGTHAELVTRASRAGKHVFCEKPISLDRQATLGAIEAARAAGVTFQVGFHRRFDPDWAAAADRIRAGELGDVYLFRTSLRDMNPPDPAFLAGAGGFFADVTIHDLDTARWMVGEIVEVTAHGAALSDPGFADIGDIDTAVVVLRFENGALGVIDNSRAAGYGYECSTEVMGRNATVRIDHPQYRNYEWRTPGAASHGPPRDFEQRFPDAYAAELESFAQCVRDGTPARVTGHDALAAFDLARAAGESWRWGRTVLVEPQRTEAGVIYTVKQESR